MTAHVVMTAAPPKLTATPFLLTPLCPLPSNPHTASNDPQRVTTTRWGVFSSFCPRQRPHGPLCPRHRPPTCLYDTLGVFLFLPPSTPPLQPPPRPSNLHPAPPTSTAPSTTPNESLRLVGGFSLPSALDNGRMDPTTTPNVSL
jgi:hypothetical protein